MSRSPARVRLRCVWGGAASAEALSAALSSLRRRVARSWLASGCLVGALLAGCGPVDSPSVAAPSAAVAEHVHHSPAVVAITPTARPAPTAASSPPPSASASPAATPITLSGTGEQASAHVTLRAGLALIHFDHPTATPFGMFLMSAQGDHLALLANGAALGGTQSYGIPADGEYYLHVIAEDGWSASVEQPRPDDLDQQARAPGPIEGSGPNVSRPIRLRAGSLHMRWQQQGTLPFGLVLWDAAGRRRVDVVASSLAAEGTATIEVPAEDVYLLNVQSNGGWTITLDAGQR